MFNGEKVLDVHGHMTTPPEFRAFAANIVSQNTPAKLEIPDERLENALQRHLKVMDERNIDVQLLSPRPIAMWHWMRPFLQRSWCRTTNDVIAQTVRLHPDRFLGVAQLPQNAEVDTSNCIPELERAVKDLGFVGAYVNPDPGADKRAPGMNDQYWFPLYEKAEALAVPLIVHPSVSHDTRLEVIPANYQMNNVMEEFIATYLLGHSDVFERFPRLKVVICHCGGALDRFIKTDRHRPQRDLSNNLFFDTCAYDDDFLTAAIKQKGVDQMLFGTEAPGSGGAVRPDTGRPSDDLVPVIDSLPILSQEDKQKIFNRNPKKVFPSLAKF
jgi:predicted TIM-barrel fold metal-dependent hydrolase